MNLKDKFPAKDPITKILEKIAKVAHENRINIYLVGGAVRDKIMDRQSTDIDICVIGDAISFAEKFGNTVGRENIITYPKFGTAMVPFHHYVVEFATARSEVYEENSRKPIIRKSTLKDDLLRRDFTINAMAMSLNREDMYDLIDEFEGLADIDEFTIRTPLNPIETFSEDPLRMLRAVRFATQLNFRIEPYTFAAIAEVKERMNIISQERITEELRKMMMSDFPPSQGFALLKQCGLLDIILPEIADLEGVDQSGKFHHKDVFWHTLEVLDNVARVSDKFELRFAALVHDIGKPDTKQFIEGKGWSFHGHEIVGTHKVHRLCTRMKLPNKVRDYAKKLTKLHLRPIALADEGVTDSAVRRMMVEAGEELDDLMKLCRADITSKNPDKVKEYTSNFDHVEEYITEVEERDKMRAFQSPVRGDEIMQEFNLKPGREVGIIKKELEELILDGIIPNDYAAVKNYLLDHKEKFREMIN
ncbi:MAG: HD domain-containing protein [Candidatus Marinimicrobia bacterium]|nr:HD domain-containing protein [Candidatus Neomarinimicrobiota bacterium]